MIVRPDDGEFYRMLADMLAKDANDTVYTWLVRGDILPPRYDTTDTSAWRDNGPTDDDHAFLRSIGVKWDG